MIDSTIALASIALLFSIVSIVVNHKVGDRKKVKALQKEVNDFQKAFEKATREHDEKELQRLKNIEPETMKKMQEMLLLPFKGLLFILPIFILLISGVNMFGLNIPPLLSTWFPTFSITLPIGIHPSELMALKPLEPSTYGSRGFFIFMSIIFNLVFELVYSNLIEKKQNKPLAKSS